MTRSFRSLMHSGPFWMVLASLQFACLNVCVKLGAAYFSTAELVFYRCFVGLLVAIAYLRLHGASVATPILSKQMTRAIAGTMALMMNFYAVANLPLATAVTLNYTSPLFLGLLTALWLRERPQAGLMFAMLLGFIGVVALLKPTFQRDQWFAGVVGLSSGLCAGIAYLNVRQLGEAGEPESRTVFYYSLVATAAAGVWMLFGHFRALTWHNIWLVLGMGATATGAQLALTRAYRKGRTMAIASLAYITIVGVTLFGIVIWGDKTSLASWLAMGLIVASGIMASRTRS